MHARAGRANAPPSAAFQGRLPVLIGEFDMP